MTPAYVRTIREELFYEYARLVSRSRFGTIEKGSTTDTFRELCGTGVSFPESIPEERAPAESGECVYCGTPDNLTKDYLVPITRGGTDSTDNETTVCKLCKSSRGEKGIFEWLGLREKNHLHRWTASRYLKLLYLLHEQAGTLDIGVSTLNKLCAVCTLHDVCERWNTVGRLTCLCLESVLPATSQARA